MSYSNPKKPRKALPWSAEDLVKRFNAAKGRKQQWITIYREAMQYVMPNRETFYIHTPGSKKNELQYDSTAQEASEIFASRIMSTLTPSWQRWSEFKAGSDIPMDKRDDINKQLTDVNRIVFDFINHSNFSSQAHECYLDLCIGTAAMLIERGQGWDFLEFTSIPLSELYLEEGPNGRVESNYRLLCAPATVLARQFPKANWSENLSKAIQEGKQDKYEVVMASIFEPKERVWYQVVFETGGDKKGASNICQYHIEESNPWIVPRWTVTSSEIYGRGPAIKKLPDIKTLNKMTEFTLRHAAMAVAGAYVAVDDGVLNPYNTIIQPNTIIPVKEQGNLAPLSMSGAPDYSNLVRAEIVDGINTAFLASPMPSFDDPSRTATEIALRNSEMLKNAGAQLGRLKSEWIEPIIARVVDILSKEGKLPKIRIDGREVTIKHTSPLAKIEDMESLQGFGNYINIMANLEQFSPGLIAMSTKLEDTPAWLSETIGGFEQLVRTKAEAQKLAEDMARVQQAQQQQQAEQEAAQQGGAV